MPGAQMGMLNLNDMFGKAFGGRTKTRKMTVPESYAVLMAEESDKLLDQERSSREAIQAVEQNGIVFLDEIDKICARGRRPGRRRCQPRGRAARPAAADRGHHVATKHGTVKTDHILFIASGAFHIAKPSDLLPELQGRLPIRVELKALTREDFRRILTEPEASLIKQYKALLATEEVDAGLHRRRDRRAGQPRRRDQRVGREHRRPAAAYRDGAPAGGDQLHRHRPGRRRASRSTPPMCASMCRNLAKNADLSKFIL